MLLPATPARRSLPVLAPMPWPRSSYDATWPRPGHHTGWGVGPAGGAEVSGGSSVQDRRVEVSASSPQGPHSPFAWHLRLCHVCSPSLLQVSPSLTLEVPRPGLSLPAVEPGGANSPFSRNALRWLSFPKYPAWGWAPSGIAPRGWPWGSAHALTPTPGIHCLLGQHSQVRVSLGISFSKMPEGARFSREPRPCRPGGSCVGRSLQVPPPQGPPLLSRH